MKKSDITPKIIELSKEITKYWKMEIYEGCWMWFELPGDNTYLGYCMDKFREHQGAIQVYLVELKAFTYQNPVDVIPIPSLSDAMIVIRQNPLKSKNEMFIYESFQDWLDTKITEAKFHEAILEVLLGVLKEKEISDENKR